MPIFRQSPRIVIQPVCLHFLQICIRFHLGALQYRFLEVCGWTVLVGINVVCNETRRNVNARPRRDEQIGCSGNDRMSFAGIAAKRTLVKPGSHDRLPRICEQIDQSCKEFLGDRSPRERMALFEPTDGDQDFLPSAKVAARAQIGVVGHSALRSQKL
jgi:hypothetical protein